MYTPRSDAKINHNDRRIDYCLVSPKLYKINSILWCSSFQTRSNVNFIRHIIFLYRHDVKFKNIRSSTLKSRHHPYRSVLRSPILDSLQFAIIFVVDAIWNQSYPLEKLISHLAYVVQFIWKQLPWSLSFSFTYANFMLFILECTLITLMMMP